MIYSRPQHKPLQVHGGHDSETIAPCSTAQILQHMDLEGPNINPVPLLLIKYTQYALATGEQKAYPYW